jgi:hypothetical protein
MGMTLRRRAGIILSCSDRIFVSERARQILVERFDIAEQIAPPYAPSGKGIVEAKCDSRS